MYGCCTRCADSDACLLALLSSVQRNEIKVHVWERERRENENKSTTVLLIAMR